MRFLIALALCFVAVAAVSCGGGDDDTPTLTYETFAPGTLAWVSGFEDGWVKYPRREIFDQPVCNEDRLLGNVPHGAQVRVIQKKTGCSFVTYQVEFLEGDQKGAVGWIREQWLVFDGPPPAGPLEPPGSATPGESAMSGTKFRPSSGIAAIFIRSTE